MSPILVRPVREQFEHDRVIRVLQGRYRRKFEVVINPGAEQNASVDVGSIAMFPDLVLFSQERGRKLQGTVEVETTESVNTLEAMAQWAPFSRLRAPFYLYVPPNSIDAVRTAVHRTSGRRRRNLDLSHGGRPGAVHDGASLPRRTCPNRYAPVHRRARQPGRRSPNNRRPATDRHRQPRKPGRLRSRSRRSPPIRRSCQDEDCAATRPPRKHQAPRTKAKATKTTKPQAGEAAIDIC